MKYLILIILSVNTAMACQLSIPESYIPTFLNPPISGYYQKCEDKPEEACHCIDDIDPWVSELVDNEVLDYISKLNETSCSDVSDCDDKFIELSCTEFYEKIKNYDLLQVYCVKNVMKIEGKKLVESPAKKAAHEAARLAKASMESAMGIARKSQACGKDTLAYMLVRNSSKGLSNAQKVQLVSDTSVISSLLELGSLDAAKVEISAKIADGVVITEADKLALNAYIDSCKP